LHSRQEIAAHLAGEPKHQAGGRCLIAEIAGNFKEELLTVKRI
jgi:hypothetical protein